MKAFAAASDQGALNEISTEEAAGALRDSEDITSLFISPSKQSMPALPSCSLPIQKAVIISFQTRSFGHPNLIGILMGCQDKKRFVCASVICSQSLQLMLADPRINQVCETQGLQVCGVAFAGRPESEEDRLKAFNSLERIPPGSPVKVCVFASCQQTKMIFLL